MITMNVTINAVMTTTVVAVKRGASYKEIAALLRKYRVSAFPVLDDGMVVGVVQGGALVLHRQVGMASLDLGVKLGPAMDAAWLQGLVTTLNPPFGFPK